MSSLGQVFSELHKFSLHLQIINTDNPCAKNWVKEVNSDCVFHLKMTQEMEHITNVFLYSIKYYNTTLNNTLPIVMQNKGVKFHCFHLNKIWYNKVIIKTN